MSKYPTGWISTSGFISGGVGIIEDGGCVVIEKHEVWIDPTLIGGESTL